MSNSSGQDTAMAGDRLNQTSLWFSADEIKADLNRIRHQRAFGTDIEDGHLAELDEMASRLKTIANRYDAISRA